MASDMVSAEPEAVSAPNTLSSQRNGAAMSEPCRHTMKSRSIQDLYTERNEARARLHKASVDCQRTQAALRTRLEQHLRQTSCTAAGSHDWRSVVKTSAEDLGCHGLGLQLYFSWLRDLTLVFVFLAFLATPLLSANISGTMLAPNHWLGRTTIANLGEMPNLHGLTVQEARERLRDRTVRVLGRQRPISAVTVTCGCLDAMGIAAFVAFAVWHQRRRIGDLTTRHDVRHATPSDWAVRVKQLPRRLQADEGDASDEAAYVRRLRRHFTRVVQLAKNQYGQIAEDRHCNTDAARGTPIFQGDRFLACARSICCRRLHPRKKPDKQITAKSTSRSESKVSVVPDPTDNSEIVLVEIVLVRNHNGCVRKLLQRVECVQNQQRLVAQQLWFQEVARHPELHGSFLARAASCFLPRFERQLRDTTNAIRKLDYKIRRSLLESDSDDDDSKVSEQPRDVCASFIVFDRSVHADAVLWAYGQPRWALSRQLRQALPFEGARLVVERAPEPSNLAWENLDAKRSQKVYRRLVTFFFSFFLLLTSGFLCYTSENPDDTLELALPEDESSQVRLASGQIKILTGEECTECHVDLFEDTACSQVIQVASIAEIVPNSTNMHSNTIDDSFLNLTNQSNRTVEACPRVETVLLDNPDRSGVLLQQCNATTVASVFKLERPVGVGCAILGQPCNASVACSKLQRCDELGHNCALLPSVPTAKVLNSTETNHSAEEITGVQLRPVQPGACASTPWSVLATTEYEDVIRWREWGDAQDLVQCWCQGQSEVSLLSSNKLRELCHASVMQRMRQFGWVFLGSVLVLLINGLLEGALESLSRWELPSSESEHHKSLMLKLFTAEFLNTGILAMVMNADFGLETSADWMWRGEHHDLDTLWYSNVGSAIILTMTINTLTNPLGAMWSLCWQWFWRRWQLKHACSVLELRQSHTNPAFNLAARYASVLNTVFVCLMYSSAMPILLPIGALCLFLTYWCDKLVLLRASEVPPAFDDRIAKAVAKLMLPAALIHSAVGIWALSHQDAFPSHPLNTEGDGNSLNPEERALTSATVPLMMLFCASGALVLLDLLGCCVGASAELGDLIMGALGARCRMLQSITRTLWPAKKREMTAGTYRGHLTALRAAKFLHSYQPEQHPRYAPLLATISQIIEDASGLSRSKRGGSPQRKQENEALVSASAIVAPLVSEAEDEIAEGTSSVKERRSRRRTEFQKALRGLRAARDLRSNSPIGVL